MKTPDAFVSHFLNITDLHQLADLRPMLVCPSFVEMTEDGCLHFTDEQPHEVDGYDHVAGGLHLPVIPECRDRLHAMHFGDGEVLLQLWCMSPSSEHFNSIVKCSTCESCPVRRGRE